MIWPWWRHLPETMRLRLDSSCCFELGLHYSYTWVRCLLQSVEARGGLEQWCKRASFIKVIQPLEGRRRMGVRHCHTRFWKANRMRTMYVLGSETHVHNDYIIGHHHTMLKVNSGKVLLGAFVHRRSSKTRFNNIFQV
jgi:hypothetical protein